MKQRRKPGKQAPKGPRTPGQAFSPAAMPKRRLLLLGAAVCAAVVGLVAASGLWPGKEAPREMGQLLSRHTPRAASQPAAREPAALPPEPSALPPEPEPAPPEPQLPRPLPSDSAPGPTAVAQLSEEGLKQEAMEAVDRLVKDFPKSADAMGLKGELYVALGKTAEAVGCWEKCIELDPRCAEAYRFMAELALRKGQYEKAAALSRKVLQIDPNRRGIHAQLAQALIGLGKPREAIAELEEDARISPRASLSRFLLGQAHQQLKEYQKAKENYQKALQIDPHYTEASYGLAIVCTLLGQKKEAAEYQATFKRLKAGDWKRLADPRDSLDEQKFLASLSRGVAQTLTKVGLLYRQHEYGAKAEELWRRAAMLDPTHTVCREELAALYAEKKRDEDALRVYKQLREIVPTNPQYHLNTGILHARLNQMDAALSAVKQAVELDPGNVQYRQIYERIREGK